ncbi:MAG: TPR end-of-group domain-containing protein [Gemmatimonadota bacterium]
MLNADSLAEAALRRALELQPDEIQTHQELAELLQLQGRRVEALAHAQRAVELDPAFSNAHRTLGRAYLLGGNYAQAKRSFERAREQGTMPVVATINLAHLLMSEADKSTAARLLEQAEEWAERFIARGDERWIPRYWLAQIAAVRGNDAEAYAWLDRAVKAGWRAYREAQSEPIFSRFNRQPRFQQLMVSVQVMVDEQRRIAQREGLI